MSESRSWWSNPRVWVLAIVVFAAAARLSNIAWDQNHFFHPDERAVVSAVQRLSFRPLQWNPQFFAYGSLPIYLAKGVSSLASLVDPHASTYDGIILNGRRQSAVIGTLTVFLLILLGHRLYGRQVGLLAGALLAMCPLHIQNSRFLAVDVTLTFVVLLALYQFVRVCQNGRLVDFLFAGALVGLATATKFSAMPLFLPLAVAAVHRAIEERRFAAVFGRCTFAVLAAFAAFALAEPYGILDFASFYHDIVEQSHMVREAGLFAYTTQYMHTPKYGYELAQLVLWGMAPPLGVVAVWASLARIGVAWRTRRAEEWVLLSWLIPFFLITGWFEVKFPRYLLPIYPLMILWAAEWLVRKYRDRAILGRVALPVVSMGTLAAAVAYMSIYAQPHTIVTASEWVYRHVPAGSKILSQDWDEGFPFSLPAPGMNPAQYEITNFGYYERPDGPAKIQKLSQALARADFIVFQTKRLYGAVTRAPERYPLTANYFYQLFAGDLGFTLYHEVAVRPSLFGFEFPDELADESITVYDHPKVLIFRNTGRLDAASLFDKIVNGVPSRPITRNDILAARPDEAGGVSASGRVPPLRSAPTALILFVLLVEALSLSAYPVLRRWFPGTGTMALSKTLGVLLFAYISWLLVSTGVATFSRGTLTAVTAAFLVVGLLAWRREGQSPLRADVIATEALFLGAFAFFLAVRSFNPEIYWGEKPMDFSFLNALNRTTTLPPPEPWFAGSPLYYSYFGYYTVAALGKTLNLDPALTFNLGIALVAGLTAVAAFAAGAAVTERRGTGWLAAIFVTLIGNLSGPRELMGPHPNVTFDYFWATSRVIRETINEYPFWSFLFADLHAHVMVMPISLTFVCLTILWVRATVLDADVPKARGTVPVMLLFLSLCLGAIAVTNAWSVPTYVLLFPFVLGTLWLTEGRHPSFFRFLGGACARVFAPWVLIAVGAYVLFFPFWAYFSPPERNWGWERGTLAPPLDFLTIWGVFLGALVPFLWVLWSRELRRDDGRLGGARIALLVVSIATMVASVFVSTRAFALILFLLGLQVLLATRSDRRWRIPVALATFGFAITAGCDLVYVWDRMNTIFKFYLEAWFLLAIAAAVAMWALWTAAVPSGRLRPVWRLVMLVLIGTGVFTAVTATWGILRTNRVPTPKPTINGIAYLPLRSPDEFAAYEWLNANVQGIPVLLEAHGDSYQEFTRVSMNTGLPTVLGWGYHVFQRSHPWNQINMRKADIQSVYTTDNKETAAAILERYHVALVFVGALERRTYGGGNLEHFGEWTDILTPVYQNPGVTIFAVRGRFTGAIPVTTIEELPHVEGAPEAPPPQDAPGRLQQPRGIAVRPDGDIFVCDFGNHRIQEFRSDLAFVRTWGKNGELPGEFREPCAIAVTPGGGVVVADTWNQRVQVFDKQGKYLREWAPGFYGPRGVAVDSQGAVFVSDTGNNRVIRFSANGTKEAEWGKKGTEPGQFHEPCGVAVSTDGRVYVADNGNGRVQVFSRDGELRGTFPVPGWESKVYSEPHLTVDPAGNLWATVSGEKEVRVYDRDGKLLRTIKTGTIPGVVFETPMGIAYSSATKEIVISDLDHRLVRIPYGQP